MSGIPGETERISALEINPDTYFALMDSDSEEAETEQIQEDEIQEEQRQEETEESSYVLDGHILRTRERATLGKGAAAGELDISLPESFDLREVGVLTPVRDQRMTNTCWAFGSTAGVESSYLLNGSNLYDFNYS